MLKVFICTIHPSHRKDNAAYTTLTNRFLESKAINMVLGYLSAITHPLHVANIYIYIYIFIYICVCIAYGSMTIAYKTEIRTLIEKEESSQAIYSEVLLRVTCSHPLRLISHLNHS